MEFSLSHNFLLAYSGFRYSNEMKLSQKHDSNVSKTAFYSSCEVFSNAIDDRQWRLGHRYSYYITFLWATETY